MSNLKTAFPVYLGQGVSQCCPAEISFSLSQWVKVRFCVKLCYHLIYRHYQVPNLWFEGQGI
jgi:hypothetical protein